MSLGAGNAQITIGEYKLPPVDAATGTPELVKVRNALIQAANNHDLGAVESMTDPDVRGCGFQGLREFEQVFLQPSEDYDPWADFKHSLTMGGIFDSPREFKSNYVVAAFPSEPWDTEYYGVVVGSDVPLRSAPSSHSARVATLSDEIVILGTGDPNPQWKQVTTHTGQTGYLENEAIQIADGLMIVLGQTGAGWRMTAMATRCD